MQKRVEVHIGGEVAASLKSSVSQASGSMRAFSSEVKGLSRGISDVGAYRKLRSEVYGTATEFRSAKQELSVLSHQVNVQKNHLGSLQGKLQEQRSVTKQASLSWNEKKDSLSMMRHELLKAREAFARSHQKLEGMNRVSRVATERYNAQKLSLQALEKAYSQNYDQLSRSGNALEKEKQKLRELNDETRTQFSLVRKTEGELRKRTKNSEILGAAYGRQKTHLESLRSSLQKAGVSVRHLEADERRLQRALDATNSRMKAAAALDQKRSANKEVMRSAPGEIMAVAYSAIPLAAPVMHSASFEASGSNLLALASPKNGIGPEFENLKKMALGLGSDRQISYNANEAMDSMKYMAMAGLGATDIKTGIADVLRLSMAGDTEASEASDIGTNIMSAYGLKGEDLGDVGDILTKAFTSSNMTLGSMGEIMKYVGPVAGMLAKSDSADDKKDILVKMSAMSGMLGDSGIGASMGGTGLRKIATSLSAPTGESKTLLDDMGVATKDSRGNLREIDDILTDISRSMDGLGSAERTETLKKIFGEEALASAAVLTKAAGSGELKKAIANVGQYKGVMSEIAKTKMDNTLGSFKALQSSFVSTSIIVGNTFLPVVRTTLDVLTYASALVGSFAESFPFLTGTIVSATAGILGFKVATLSYNLVSAVMSGGLMTASKALYFFTGIQLGSSKITGGLTLKTMALSFAKKEIALSTALATRASAFYNAVSKSSLVISGLSIARTLAKGAAMGILTLAYGNSTAASVALTGATALLSTAYAACPVGWLVGGLSAIAGGFVLAYKKVEWFRSAVDWVWDRLKGIGSTILEFLGLSLPKLDLVADLDTSKALQQQSDLQKQLKSKHQQFNREEKTPSISEPMRVLRPLQQAKVSKNLTAKVINFRKKTAEDKQLNRPVNDRIVSRVPKQIAMAASLAASPVPAAALKHKVSERSSVAQSYGNIKNEYKFEMHIHGADSKKIPEIKDEMQKLIKQYMAEAQRKSELETRRQLMDRSKGGMF